MKIVLDANVLVSRLLQPFHPPGEIVRMVSSGILELCYDARILAEYREVLARPKFRLEKIHVEALLDLVKAAGFLVAPEPLRNRLPDASDEMFLEVALAGQAQCLVTGNLKDYPVGSRQGMVVVSPAEWLEIYRREAVR